MACHQRQTLAREVPIEGVGLHTGRTVRVRLCPAPARSGVVFVRTDAGAREIPADLDHTVDCFYATVLGDGEVRVSTVEHLMAAVYALRIDDLRVEIDGPEVPILDGSSRPFVDALQAAGRAGQGVERQYLTLVRPVVVEEEDKRIAAYPGPDFRVTYAIDFDHPMLGYQELSASLWKEGDFADKLAPARTFTFERDVQSLRDHGLVQGGSLDNAVVLGEAEVLNPELRFPDEFVRHKMLDLTGDLSLLGHPLRAHVVGYRAGHELHAALARRIRDSRHAWYLAPWSDAGRVSPAAAEV